MRPREAPLLLPLNDFTNTWHPPSLTLNTPKFYSDILPPPSMFNRDRLPGLPGSSPRPPPRNDGYGRPPPQQQPPQGPPRGQDTRMAGYDDRPQQQRMPARGPPGGGGGGGGPPRQLRPIKSPGGNAYAFGNMYVQVAAMSPAGPLKTHDYITSEYWLTP